MPALLLLTGPSAGLRYEVVVEATLGRSPSCEIPLEDSKVSRRHAKIVVKKSQARITDLGSRNGTVVNGEKIEGEAVLLAGDRVQVGDSTVLFEPPAKASFTDDSPTTVETKKLEEVLPASAPDSALYWCGLSLLPATSEAMVLRKAAEELARSLPCERAAALLGSSEGLLTAAVVGAETVEVPRSVVKAALEQQETSRAGGMLCVPITASGGLPFGILYAMRPQGFKDADLRLAAALGRLTGEALAAVRSRFDREQHPVILVGASRQFRKVVEQARRAAAAADPVMLFGERGSGKRLAAQYIHTRSSRALGPIVVVDCRQPAVSVDEELFGRPSGPGTPPLSSALWRADGGTLVLRQIEGLPRHSAGKLADLIARKVAPARQGSEEPVDVRIVATASDSIDTLTARGEIDDSLARVLGGNEIELLPLRDRRTDVPMLFELFAGRVAKTLRKEPPLLSPDARRLLVDYPWPGNVSELKLVAERLGQIYAGTEIAALRLPPEIQEGSASTKRSTLQDMVSRLEREAIAEALREARGKKIRAAALLGISRPTLDKKIADYQLVVEKVRKP